MRAELAEAYHRVYARLFIKQSTSRGVPSTDLLPGIRLTMPLDDILKNPVIDVETVEIVGTGTYTFFTVPVGERWEVTGLHATRTGGTFTIDQILLVNADGNATQLLVEEFTQTSLLWQAEGPAYVIDAGYKIAVHVDAHSVNGDLILERYYVRYPFR